MLPRASAPKLSPGFTEIRTSRVRLSTVPAIWNAREQSSRNVLGGHSVERDGTQERSSFLGGTLTTPNLASVAIRPLRRPAGPLRDAARSVSAGRLPIHAIGEILAVLVLLFVGYTAVTDNWLSSGVGAFSDWYSEAVAPHLDPPLTIHRPLELGPVGLADQWSETSPFSSGLPE